MPATLSREEKIELVLICGENYKCARDAANIFNQRHPGKNVHFTTVARILKRFKETGSVENNFKVPHNKTVCNEENSLEVLLTVAENPHVSIAQISGNTNISSTSVGRILESSKFHPYKPKFIHVLKDRDYDVRFDFCAWYQGMIEVNPNFTKNVLFSDESTFTSNGTVSSQNCRWWADENTDFVVANRDQYRFKVNVWCGICNSQIVGPFFFRENLNAERYYTLLDTELTQFLDNIPLAKRAELYFQKDGASIHSTRQVRRWLDNEFDAHWIGRYSVNY